MDKIKYSQLEQLEHKAKNIKEINYEINKYRDEIARYNNCVKNLTNDMGIAIKYLIKEAEDYMAILATQQDKHFD